jgi:hypothetical protein
VHRVGKRGASRDRRGAAAKTEVRPSRTRPPGADTGYAHARCYASQLTDCCTTISREHYISESILEDHGGVFYVTRKRLGWEAKQLPANALAAKMLCKRHNSALSPLDEAGRSLVRCLRFAQDRAAAGRGCDVLNGIDVERWMLKMLCGYTVLDGDPVPLAWQRLLFGYDEMRLPSGLHVNVAIGDSIGGADGQIKFSTAYNAGDERVGCAVTLHGYRFLLSLDGKRVFGADELGKQSMMHPRELKFTGPRGNYRLRFAWPWR